MPRSLCGQVVGPINLGLENMEGPAPAGLPWVSACGERRCQSHMRRLRSQPEQETGPMKNETKVYVGMDVHKDSVMVAVLPEGVRGPTVVKRLSHDPRGLRRLLGRLARRHEVRACYEASGAGYVLERMIRGWGHACEIVAPSLIPRRPGEQRKHDRKDAEELARLYRAGEPGDDPGADGAGGAGARPGALPGGVSARDPEVAPLHPQVPGTPRSGVPGGQELDGQAN